MAIVTVSRFTNALENNSFEGQGRKAQALAYAATSAPTCVEAAEQYLVYELLTGAMIVTKAIAASVTGPTPAGNITASNVLAVLTATLATVDNSIIGDPDLTIHMSTRDWRYYGDAMDALTYKGPAYDRQPASQFKGIPIQNYSGFPNNYVLICKSGRTTNTSLHAAVNASNDPENLLIEKWRPEGDIYFLKATFSMAVNFPFASEMVLYQPS